MLGGAVDGHGDGGVVVFQAGQIFPPYFARAHVAIFYSVDEGEVKAFDIRREDGSARAEADVEELGCWINSKDRRKMLGLRTYSLLMID